VKFKRHKNSSARAEALINLTPLIDVIFVLLLFFVVSTTFNKPNQIKINLPEVTNNTVAETSANDLEISISADGIYLVNGKSLAMQDAKNLTAAIQQQAGNNTSQAVIITADANTAHQAVITAMDVVGKLGFSKIRITTIYSANSDQ